MFCNGKGKNQAKSDRFQKQSLFSKQTTGRAARGWHSLLVAFLHAWGGALGPCLLARSFWDVPRSAAAAACDAAAMPDLETGGHNVL